MANLKVNAVFTAPENIEIPLVRADVMRISGIFRVCFEVALSITSTLLGYVLSLTEPTRIHWVFLGVCLIATGAFLYLTYSQVKSASVAG